MRQKRSLQPRQQVKEVGAPVQKKKSRYNIRTKVSVSIISGSVLRNKDEMSKTLSSGSIVPNPPPISTPAISSELIWFAYTFRPHFEEWIFGPIDRLVCSKDALIGFIFMSCSIDYLAGFWRGRETHRTDYIDFIKTYFPNGKYDERRLYESLRCGLVHMFTIKDRKYALTHNNPTNHLKSTDDGHIVLNAGNFRDDLFSAAQKYFNDVQADPLLLQKLIDRYNNYGFLDLQPLTIQY